VRSIVLQHVCLLSTYLYRVAIKAQLLLREHFVRRLEVSSMKNARLSFSRALHVYFRQATNLKVYFCMYYPCCRRTHRNSSIDKLLHTNIVLNHHHHHQIAFFICATGSLNSEIVFDLCAIESAVLVLSGIPYLCMRQKENKGKPTRTIKD